MISAVNCGHGMGAEEAMHGIRLLARLHSDRSGVTAIEYALIASLIAMVIVVAVTTIGTTLSTTFSSVAVAL